MLKYTRIVAIESAVYRYEKLVDYGHVELLADEEWRLKPSFMTLEEKGFFCQAELATIRRIPDLAFGRGAQSIVHKIRPIGK